jgi:hypothetical protein
MPEGDGIHEGSGGGCSTVVTGPGQRGESHADNGYDKYDAIGAGKVNRHGDLIFGDHTRITTIFVIKVRNLS